MNITAVTIENFKGIKDPVRIELKPITLLFGPNSAGKSTIVQALHYAREIFERGNVDPDSTILGGRAFDLGGFVSLVHNKALDLPISLRFDFDLKDIDLSDFVPKSNEYIELSYGAEDDINDILNPIQNGWVKIVVKWDLMTRRPIIDVFEIGINHWVFCRFRHDHTYNRVQLLLFDNPMLKRIHERNDFRNFEINEIFGFDKPKQEDGQTVIDDGYEEHEEAHYYVPEEVDIQEDWGDSLDDMESDSFTDDYGAEERENDEEWQSEENGYDERPDLPPADIYQEDIEREMNNSEFQQSDIPGPDSEAGTVIPLDQISILPLLADEVFFMAKSENESQGKDFFLNLMVDSLITAPIAFLKESLRKLCYVGPIRELPSRNFEAAKSPDESRWSTGLAAWDVLHNSDPSFVRKVNKWLGGVDYLNSGYTLTVREFREVPVDNPFMAAVTTGQLLDEDQEEMDSLLNLPIKKKVALKDKYNGIEVLPSEVGIGISQVVPVIVASVHARSGIVIIEQPELHIHPAFQVALGDLFIAESQGKDIVFLLETHSEHLMLRLLRRIRETSEESLPPGKDSLVPDSLAVYFLEQTQAATHVARIRIDEEGEFIDKWPKGFFSERMGELF